MIKIAYTGWMWLREYGGDRDAIRRHFEQSVKELSHLGYRYLENMASFVVPYFEPREVRDICEKYGMKFVALYTNLVEGYDTLRGYIDFLKAAGASYMISMSPNWELGRNMGDLPVDREAIREQAALCDRLGEYAASQGITFCYNPHSYTDIAGAEEFALFAELTDPKKVRFCLDCGHATVSGVEPLGQIEQYYDRLAYMHLKDVDPTVPKVAPQFGRVSFVPLGFGTVNVKGVLRLLEEKGFDGYACVGMPPPCAKINDYESAAISKAYLRLNCDIL